MGWPSEDGYALRFENWVCLLPELKSVETVKHGNTDYTILELIRMHPRYGKDFFEIEEIDPSITKSVIPKNAQSNKTMNINNGHMAEAVNPLDILNNPNAKELIMSLAQELAKSMTVKKEDTTPEESQKESDETLSVITPTEVIQGVNDDFINWDNLTIAGRPEPYKSLDGLMKGLKTRGVSVIVSK